MSPADFRRVDAARYVGISPTHFDKQVRAGTIPAPLQLFGVNMWDRTTLDALFDGPQKPADNDDYWDKACGNVNHVDRHGQPRVYLRRPGRAQVALPAPLYTPEFWTAYHAAMSADEPTPMRHIKAGTVAAAVQGYYRSTEFKALATTQEVYRNILNRFVDKHGDGPIAGIQAKHVNKLIDEMADTPSAASNFRKRLKSVMDYAVSVGLRSDNPVVAAKRVKLKTTGHRTWTEENIAIFRGRWPVGSPLRLAMEMLLHTGLRRSDAVRLGWKHLTEDGFVIATKKSQGHVELCIPVHTDLARYITKCPKDGQAFIVRQRGWTSAEVIAARPLEGGLPTSCRDAMQRAGNYVHHRPCRYPRD